MTNSVRVSVGLTINLGNYQSARLSLDMERECDDPDKLAVLGDVLYRQLEDELMDKAARLLERIEKDCP